MLAWTTTRRTARCSRLVLLADPAGEHPSVTRVRTAAVSLAEGRGAEVSEIAMDGDTPLLRLASAVQLLDYASVYLGIACGIDPLAIAAIKDLRDLAERSVVATPMKAVIAALAANLGIAIAKFAAFLVTGSASMLAESVHSVADTGNELLLLIGSGRSRRARTELHPFGFGRERYFYAFVVAVMLFTVGAVFSIYDGVHKILSPEEVRVAGGRVRRARRVAVLESFSLRTAIREANKERGRQGWRGFVHATKSPELPVVLLEDTAALLGLGFAFLGVLLSVVTGQRRVGRRGLGGGGRAACLRGVHGRLRDEEPADRRVGDEEMSALDRRRRWRTAPRVSSVIHLRTSHIGPDSLLVAAKIAVPGSLSAADLVTRIDAAERRVRDAVPIAETIYLEPDIYLPGQGRRHRPVHPGGAPQPAAAPPPPPV